MQSIMETGQALYVLAGICLLGIITRLLTRNLYKRLMKESSNLAAAKNKSLKELKQRAENAYHVNQGMRDTGSWLERQLGELHFRGMTLAGWTNLSTQLTWLCLLAGGGGAFYAYWNRMDTSYIVMYGGGAVLMAMLTMLFDGGIAASRRDQLISILQDYLENTMFPRMGRISERISNIDRGQERISNMDRSPERASNMDRSPERIPSIERGTRLEAPSAAPEDDYKESPFRRKRTEIPAETAVTVAEPLSSTQPETDPLRRGLEQMAARRERSRPSQGKPKISAATAENLLKELSPDDLQVINDILKQYLT